MWDSSGLIVVVMRTTPEKKHWHINQLIVGFVSCPLSFVSCRVVWWWWWWWWWVMNIHTCSSNGILYYVILMSCGFGCNLFLPPPPKKKWGSFWGGQARIIAETAKRNNPQEREDKTDSAWCFIGGVNELVFRVPPPQKKWLPSYDGKRMHVCTGGGREQITAETTKRNKPPDKRREKINKLRM